MMLRIALLRGLAMVAFFAAAWLAPLRAMAAIVPICDGDAVSAWGPTVQAGQTADTTQADDCRAAPSNGSNAGSNSDELRSSHVAAMCDARAATVIAPNRIHPMSDGRIDAVVSCDGMQHGPFASSPNGNHYVDGLSWANVDPAMLTEPVMVRPRIYIELPPAFVDSGSPRVGFDREIYHPPRA
jgi:hypothetical protein